ncbi:MAG TPA: class I SAM-dependent methyltransferase [Terriglobales bacterium]|nr:class I SAM-dependent methyltransferase [Terriglobales bacterium]
MEQFPELVRRFALPLVREKRWRSFCEIGSRNGDSANVLLGIPGVSLSIIDPCLDADLVQRYATEPRVAVHRAISLDALPVVEGQFDCIFIDGDHNWYTVYNELRVIRQRRLLRTGGMIFFHDVSWPYGRRDMYYQPELIPPEHRLPYEQVDVPTRLPDGKNIDVTVFHAIREGGEKNGVLTAVEDFTKEHPGEYFFWRVRRLSGLGMLQYRTGGLGERVAFLALVQKAILYDSRALLARTTKAFRRPEKAVS